MYRAAEAALEAAAGRGLDVAEHLERVRRRQANAAAYSQTVDRYAWPTNGLEGVQIAPFQLLAASGQALYGRGHEWHMAVAERLAAADQALIRPTRWLALNPGDQADRRRGVQWWEDLTRAGGEGMVVKPAAGPVKQGQRLVQPGLKVRGRDYLRMTYGPDYLDRLGDLRQRQLGLKRSLALREYALGLEAIDRLVAGDPLWRRHEAVFAVLALESEPTDPRL
ncbi:MAG: hypothetical protein LBC97_07815, partial [Bifidobacteriaceae bacterium]|jgi:hypothetical protein|nr:hypothetical protein [Bifidobacteriaceae bacterium]